MKKIFLAISIPMLATASIIAFSGPVAAKVTGPCDNCHTMHNSQGGSPMNRDDSATPNKVLLRNSCIGCHSSSASSMTYALGECDVAVVNYTGGSPPIDYLAGGHFYWVKPMMQKGTMCWAYQLQTRLSWRPRAM